MRANTTKTKPKRAKVLPPCRVTDAEILAFKKKAKAAGLSLSEFQRQAMNDSVLIIREPIADKQLIKQLSAIGNNLNQLARNEHIHDEADTQKLRDLCEKIEQLYFEVLG